jgi:divalent metal cation (Fe/Co/Zn/Cd) transporter
MSAIVAFALLFVGVGLILEAVTALFARSGDATEHRQ